MTIRSWELKSWPAVPWNADAGLGDWPVFQHMGTEIRPEPDELGRLVGDTVWVAKIGEAALIGAAWEWVEARPGVPAVRDPNGFVCNARFVAADGTDLSELQAVVVLNLVAHSTAWQAIAVRLAGDAREVAALAKSLTTAQSLGFPIIRPRRPSANAPVLAQGAVSDQFERRTASA